MSANRTSHFQQASTTTQGNVYDYVDIDVYIDKNVYVDVSVYVDISVYVDGSVYVRFLSLWLKLSQRSFDEKR